MIRVGTVFSGIGAVEHALERMDAEHKIEFACDNGNINIFDKYSEEEKKEILEKMNSFSNFEEKKEYIDELFSKSRKTNFVKQSYLANYDLSEKHFHQDITLLDGEPYKNKIDLFVGGSPCQSFSTFGNRAGLEDTRGTLFYEFARLVKEIQPKVFVYENVKGMLTHDKGNTWKVIKEVFDELGYTYYYDILNAKDFEIPQSRNRIFVVGFKNEIDFKFPTKKELKTTMKDFLQSVTPSLYRVEKNKPLEEETSLQIEEKYFLSEKIKKTILSTGTKGFYIEPEVDRDIAKTLLATMAKMHRAGVDNYVTTNGRLRRLTPKEALRLMGFCDSFKHVVSDSQLYKQAGNSIVVDVLMAILKEIIETNVFEQ